MSKRLQRPLTPTLWRTCRALANRRRLQMMRYLTARRTPVHVTELAQQIGIPVPVASQYLRLLNSRGLLQAKRIGRSVLYKSGSDPSMPATRALLQGLQASLKRGPESVEAAFSALTGFTHPRRIALLRAVAHGASSVRALCSAAGTPRRSTSRHLRKLVDRGYLRTVRGHYGISQPRLPLAFVLLNLVLSRT